MGDVERAGTGGEQFALAWRLAAAGWVGCALLQLLLYLRPSPYGGPFLLEWRRYFGWALYYDLLGVWLLSLPFLLLWLLLYHHPVRPRGARAVHLAQAALLSLNLLLSQFDHEVLRFLGVRLDLSFLLTYVQPRTLGDSLFSDVLVADRGGPFVPLLLLVAVPGLYAWWAARSLGGNRRAPRLWLAWLIAVLPLAAPGNAWSQATSQFRLRKTEPVVLALANDVRLGFRDAQRPADFDRLASQYQQSWLAQSGERGWRFSDPARPYLRVPADPASPSGPRWNIIYLQLETFRGVDMGFLRPGLKPSPTPFLDSLADGPRAATWTRALSFGMPSINGLFATHCSITSHSRRYMTSFRNTRLYCLPDVLRAHGYRSEIFNAGDTDWDNATLWLRVWYDRLWRYPEARERDRDVFRAAAARIRALGRSGRPFLATVVSVSNHTPFRTREPALDIAGRATPGERIRNTTHYTDDVVREFLQGLAKEPWFERTLVVITGDHGFNLAEHAAAPGTHNLYRESVWVPLLIVGAHPRLRPGRHDDLVTLLDLTPTLADLVGVREANPWQGHSLLARAGPAEIAFAVRESRLAETGSWAALVDPDTGRRRLYDSRHDWFQRRDVGELHPKVRDGLLRRAEEAQRLNDYLLRQGLVWRRPASSES
jgi:hypothetical protein